MEYTKQDIDNLYKYQGFAIKCLKFFFLWPDNERNYDIWFKIKQFLVLTPGFFVCYGCICHFVYLFQAGALEMIFREDLMALTTALSFSCVIITMVLTVDSIIKIVFLTTRYMDEQEKPPEIEEHHRKQKKVVIVLYMILIFVETACVFWKYIFVKTCEFEKQKYNLTTVCEMFVNLRLPFEYDYFPVKQLILVLECGIIFYEVNGIFTIAFLLYDIICIIIIRLQYLSRLLEHAKITGRDIDLKFLFKWIEYHNNLISLVDSINDVTWTATFFLFLTTNVMIAFLEVTLLLNPSLDVLIQFICWTSGMTILHLSSQCFINEAEKLCDTVYNTKWYEMEPKYRYIIRTILQRTQKKMTINFGPVSDFSAESLVMLAKVSYSYMTVMMQYTRKYS